MGPADRGGDGRSPRAATAGHLPSPKAEWHMTKAQLTKRINEIEATLNQTVSDRALWDTSQAPEDLARNRRFTALMREQIAALKARRAKL